MYKVRHFRQLLELLASISHSQHGAAAPYRVVINEAVLCSTGRMAGIRLLQ